MAKSIKVVSLIGMGGGMWSLLRKHFFSRRMFILRTWVILSVSILSGCASIDKVKVVDIDPSIQAKEGVRPIMKEADQYYLVGEYQKAEAIYLKLVNQKTKDPLVFYRLGNIAFKRNEIKKAQGYYDSSLQLMPNNSKAHFNISIVYLSLAWQHLQNYGKNAPPETDLHAIEWMMGAIDQYLARSTGGRASNTAPESSPAYRSTAPKHPAETTSPNESDSTQRQDSLDSLVKELQGL